VALRDRILSIDENHCIDCSVQPSARNITGCANVIDHTLLSTVLFESRVAKCYVIHDGDDISDHDPIIVMQLILDLEHFAASRRRYVPRVSWAKASEYNVTDYTSIIWHLICITLHCLRNFGVSTPKSVQRAIKALYTKRGSDSKPVLSDQ